MTPDREIERVLQAWLEPGPSTMPDRLFDAVLDQVERTPQHRTLRLTSRFPAMFNAPKILIAAALVAIVSTGSVFLFPLAQGPVDPSPSPAPSGTPRPTTLPLGFAELEAGTYALGNRDFYPTSPIARMFATVPDGWGGIAGRTFGNLFQLSDEPMVGSIGIAIPSNFFVDPCDTTRGLWDPPLGPTVDDFVEAISNVPGYRASDPVDIEWLGYPGKSLEEIGPDSVAECTDGFAHAWETEFNETAEYLVGGQHNLVWVVDIDGTRVVVTRPQSIAPPSPTPTDPAGLADQQQVFDSIRIEPLPSSDATVTASPPG